MCSAINQQSDSSERDVAVIAITVAALLKPGFHQSKSQFIRLIITYTHTQTHTRGNAILSRWGYLVSLIWFILNCLSILKFCQWRTNTPVRSSDISTLVTQILINSSEFFFFFFKAFSCDFLGWPLQDGAITVDKITRINEDIKVKGDYSP